MSGPEHFGERTPAIHSPSDETEMGVFPIAPNEAEALEGMDEDSSPEELERLAASTATRDDEPFNDNEKAGPKSTSTIYDSVTTTSLQLIRQRAKQARGITARQERRFAERAKAGDMRARETLIVANLGDVLRAAPRYRRSGVELDDLIQVGAESLIKIVDHNDPSKGFRVTTLARRGIRIELFNHSATQSRNIAIGRDVHRDYLRIRSAQSMLIARRINPTPEEIIAVSGLDADRLEYVMDAITTANTKSLDEPLDNTEDDSGVLADVIADPHSVEEEVEANFWHQALKRLMDEELTPIERVVIERIDGLWGQQPQQQSDVAYALNVSQRTVSKIYLQALAKLEAAGDDLSQAA